jgi:hypothetical protein
MSTLIYEVVPETRYVLKCRQLMHSAHDPLAPARVWEVGTYVHESTAVRMKLLLEYDQQVKTAMAMGKLKEETPIE